MSIHLAVHYKGSEPSRDIFYPMSSQEHFNKYWMPPAKEHRLFWVEMSGTASIDFLQSFDHMEEIKHDFNVLREILDKSKKGDDTAIVADMVKRLDRMLGILDQISEEKEEIEVADIG